MRILWIVDIVRKGDRRYPKNFPIWVFSLLFLRLFHHFMVFIAPKKKKRAIVGLVARIKSYDLLFGSQFLSGNANIFFLNVRKEVNAHVF